MHLDVTPRSLLAVLVLDRERHFGRAAEALGIAQPSLSQLVKRVEEAVGAQLFERRPVRPTPAGRVFLDRVAASLGALEEAVGAARATSAGRVGTLHIGFAASVVFSPMPAILAAFRRESPRVDVMLSELSTADQLDLVAAGKLDLGFVRQFRARRDLQRIRILHEPFFAVLPADHPLGGGDHVPIAALAGEPFVHFPRREAPDLYDELMRRCAAVGFAPRIVQSAARWVTIVALVEAGLGVALVPRSLTRLAWPGVRFLPVKPAGKPAEVFAVFPRAGLSTPAEKFREVLRTALL